MPAVNEIPPMISTLTVNIANGQTTSTAIDLSGASLVGIQMPAAFTGTSISFQVATSVGGTYQTMIDASGSTISKTISASKYLVIDPAEFAGVQFFKIVSGSSEGASRDLTLVARPV